MSTVKLMTLNTHSLIEQDYEEKRKAFVGVVALERPVVIALQEVNQSMDAAPCPPDALTGYQPCMPSVDIREDHHGLWVSKDLKKIGQDYYWTWLPVKKGYEKYDEGIALFSLSPILETDVITVTPMDEYDNWKTRKILGIRTAAMPEQWFYSVHFGWWSDEDAPFIQQWERAQRALPRGREIWLMGDFNNPAHICGEGYDLVAASGWYDSYTLATEKDGGVTVNEKIAGWEASAAPKEGLRIDQIWCNRPCAVRSSRVIFNGVDTPKVSDHFGVMVTTEQK